MRAFLLTILLLASAASALAERNKLQPTDFEPLTSLPWKKPDATLAGVLDAIFREPNLAIRYPVLAEYLRTIPVAELGKAFELCIDFAGTQTPDELIYFFLPIWGERDPKTCWKRTRELFRFVGIEDGWLGHDSWKETYRITVQDPKAIRASRFWIGDRNSLNSFPIGVDRSSLPRKERVRLMKEFTDEWLDAFGSWTGYEPVPRSPYYLWSYADAPNDVARRFADPLDADSIHRTLGNLGNYAYHEAEFEVIVRRWLQAKPAAAPEILKLVQEKKWPPSEGKLEPRAAGPSIELLLIWAKTDLPAMIRWAESLDLRKDDLALKAKGFLMSRVDAETRERWLAEAKSDKAEDDRTENLLTGWAGWDPTAALDAALATKTPGTISGVAIAAAIGPWRGNPLNTCHFGLGVIKGFDTTKFPESYRKEHFMEWYEILEWWGHIDIGETARYGLDFMLRNDFAPREILIKFFSGEDGYTDDDMIDRTFCALRVWAVVKPDEMKAWIATLKDAEMRKALTWLLEHPWGGERKEKAAAKK